MLLAHACSSRDEELARALTGGEPSRGREELAEHGCGACHEIPGVKGAVGKVGPSLAGLANRTYLAGRLTNQPHELMRWIQHPQQVDPGNVMPDLGVDLSEARDMASYLYTLR
jgi:cytochrome c2